MVSLDHLGITDRSDMLHTIRRLYALDDTNGASSSIPELQILCLGLGKPFSDRSAQIQLALLLELSARLQSSIHMSAYDPVSDKGDCKVLEQFGITLIEENMASRLLHHCTQLILIDGPPQAGFRSPISTLHATLLESALRVNLAHQF